MAEEVDLQEAYDSMTHEQKDACKWFVRAALYSHDAMPDEVRVAHNAMTENQRLALDHMVRSSVAHRPSEDDT